MNLYQLLNYPNFSKDFLNLDFKYGRFLVMVTGYIDVTISQFKIPYSGNLIAGGYTESEVTEIQVTVDEIQVYNEYNREIFDVNLKKKILDEISNETKV